MRGKAIDVKPCFVVKVYSYCFIAWPAEQIAPKIWAPDMGVSALDTTFVLDLDEWEALSTRVGLVRMLHEAHNSVNVRTGKRTWTLAEHYKAFARPCASKSVDVAAIVAACAVLGVAAVFVHRIKYCMRPCKAAR